MNNVVVERRRRLRASNGIQSRPSQKAPGALCDRYVLASDERAGHCPPQAFDELCAGASRCIFIDNVNNPGKKCYVILKIIKGLLKYFSFIGDQVPPVQQLLRYRCDLRSETRPQQV